MIKKDVFLTEEGLKKIKKELNEHINKKRPAVIKRIKEAKAYGDLSENSEYEDARNEQSFVEGKISELKSTIKNAQIINKSDNISNVISLGSTIITSSEGTDNEYTIVGSAEADPSKGKISNESPIGKGLLGKEVGDEVEVDVPAGKIKFKIKSIK